MFFCNYFMLSHRQTSLQIIFASINNVVFLYQHSARSRSCRRHEYNFVYFVSFVGKLKFLKVKFVCFLYINITLLSLKIGHMFRQRSWCKKSPKGFDVYLLHHVRRQFCLADIAFYIFLTFSALGPL